MHYFITKDKAKIYYEIKGEGKPIVFIHGFSEDHNSFRIQQRALSMKYKIITYDLRGHGLSYMNNYDLTIERLAIDLHEFIEYLNIDDIILVGWSMGVSIIFEYIKLFGLDKVSKLCLIDKGPKPLNDSNWNLGLYHGKYTIEHAMEDLTLIKNNWLGFAEKFIKIMSPNFTEKQFQIAMEKIKKNSPNIMYSIWNSMIEKDYRGILKDINIPTLIIFGGMSTLYSVKVGEYLNRNIKNSQLIIFDDCTHLLVLENPIRFNKVLEEFVG